MGRQSIGNTSGRFTLVIGGATGPRSRRCWTSFVRTPTTIASTPCGC